LLPVKKTDNHELGEKMKNMDSKNSLGESEVSQSLTTQSANRRALIRKAGLLTPGLLILANRPALAASCSTSGFMSSSMSTSLSAYSDSLCNGWSPGNWEISQSTIKDSAWDEAGVRRSDSFNSQFKTGNLKEGRIRRLENGIPDTVAVDYTSKFGQTFQQCLEGGMSGSHQLNDVMMHAPAVYLNASFLANGGGGSNPELWMTSYISPDDAVALFLLYELRFHTTQAAGVSFEYERGGYTVAKSDDLTDYECADYFMTLANGPN